MNYKYRGYNRLLVEDPYEDIYSMYKRNKIEEVMIE